MTPRRMVGWVACLAGGVFAFACSNDPTRDDRSRDHGKSDPTTARLIPVVAGSDPIGGSVSIKGSRSPAANALLPCASNVDMCLNFDADGKTPVVLDLCATDMSGPTGLWSFSYEVYSGPDCTGGLVPNLTCTCSTPELLPPGVVTTNDVACAFATAAKTWDFSVTPSYPDCPDGGSCIRSDAGSPDRDAAPSPWPPGS